jgi:NAD-dependent dihydropyrimidine dehydrogenase PreA subunit/nitroreductase
MPSRNASSLRLTIDADRCTREGTCTLVCPVRLLRQETEGEPPRVEHADLCVLCGQCLAVCPTAAISHSRLSRDELRPIDDAQPVEPEAFLEALRQRRSVRVYRKQPVPRELLERVVRMAGYAPVAAHGSEGWVRNVVVVSGENEMRRVHELTVSYLEQLERLLSGPMVGIASRPSAEAESGAAMLPDLGMRLTEHAHGHDAILYDAPAAVFVHAPRSSPAPQSDCDAALLTVLLAAHVHGLGGCWNGYLAKAASGFKVRGATAFRQWLEIPDHHDVLAAATLGYPAVALHSVPQRETSVRFIGS